MGWTWLLSHADQSRTEAGVPFTISTCSFGAQVHLILGSPVAEKTRRSSPVRPADGRVVSPDALHKRA